MTIMPKLLPTTVVGSYPVVRGGRFQALLDPYRLSLETAVADQRAAGIDIISDGQVRGDMIRAITSLLPGIKGQKVTGLIRAPSRPITVSDTQYALSVHSKVKGILTGPSTLAHALQIATPAYRNRNELILDLAQALAVEARHLEETGITILQIDEPILSTGAADLKVAQQAVGIITSVLRVPTCLHVCGDLSHVIDDILKIQVRILDFEFAHNPSNLEILSVRDLKGRMIGFGVVDSASPDIEPVEQIARNIRKGVDAFDPGLLLIDPDCGLRMHTRETAFAKLKHMVSAADLVRNEL